MGRKAQLSLSEQQRQVAEGLLKKLLHAGALRAPIFDGTSDRQWLRISAKVTSIEVSQQEAALCRQLAR